MCCACAVDAVRHAADNAPLCKFGTSSKFVASWRLISLRQEMAEMTAVSFDPSLFARIQAADILTAFQPISCRRSAGGQRIWANVRQRLMLWRYLRVTSSPITWPFSPL